MQSVATPIDAGCVIGLDRFIDDRRLLAKLRYYVDVGLPEGRLCDTLRNEFEALAPVA